MNYTSQKNKLYDIKSNVSLFTLDNPISYICCFPWRSSKGHPSWVQCYYRRKAGTRRKPAILGRVKPDNTLLTCDQVNFNQITAQSRSRTLVTLVRDTYTTTVPPAPLDVKNTLLPVCSSIFSKSAHNHKNCTRTSTDVIKLPKRCKCMKSRGTKG